MSLACIVVNGGAPPDPGPVAHDPFLIEGLRQRATLFERILDDLLGKQTILRRTLLPSDFLANFSALLGHGARGRAPFLREYAAELVRCADGVWRVAADLVVAADSHPAAILLEAPALAGFLPGLSRMLLGEALLLGTVPSLWLADPGALQRVAASLGRWTIVDAFRGGDPATPLADLQPAQRVALQDRVDEAPWRFAARLLVTGANAFAALVRSDQGAWQFPTVDRSPLTER